jgi:hypothetical protein
VTRRWISLGVGAILLLILATIAVTSVPGAAGSALSPAPRGLLAARRYLEERGTAALLLDRPYLENDREPEVLVVAFPWQRFAPGEDLGAVRTHLHLGATVIYAFSGEGRSFAENAFAEMLGLDWEEVRGDPPLHPVQWRAYSTTRWRLTSEGSTVVPPLEIRAPRWVPQAPAQAVVLFRGPTSTPMVFSQPVGRGHLLVVPADVLSNSGLSRAGNLALLESLRAPLPGPWTFDEFHHGLAAPQSALAAGSRFVLDLYLLQLVLLYGLAVLALGRRFGPAWTDPPVVTGSAGAFLRGLGGLHHRLGHHAEGARLLLARARELHPHLPSPPVAGGGERGLVPLAQALSRQQRAHRRNR